MTVTVTRIEVPGAQPYTALIDCEGVLVRYTSVIDPDQHFDVLRMPYAGELEWIDSSWGWLWSLETRQCLAKAAAELLRR
jgi:hypothetical protein